MRTASVRSLLFVACLTTTSATLRAQWVTPIARNVGCPVSFSVERSSQGTLNLLQARGPSASMEPKRSVSFSLRSEQGKTITSAEITLYAPRISRNATPARVTFGPTEEADLVTKTYQVEGKFPSTILSGDLNLLDSMAGVERAVVKSVSYADGTTWRPVSGATCAATPPIFIPVANR